MSPSRRIGLRVSPALYRLLTSGDDISATTRALAILGAQAAGYDLAELVDEAAALLAAPLDAPLRTALRRLLQQRLPSVPPLSDPGSTPVPHIPPAAAPEAVAPAPDDPFAQIGLPV
jgi:hypothetical protein